MRTRPAHLLVLVHAGSQMCQHPSKNCKALVLAEVNFDFTRPPALVLHSQANAVVG